MLYGRSHTTWCYIPHNCILHSHFCENLTPDTNWKYIFYYQSMWQKIHVLFMQNTTVTTVLTKVIHVKTEQVMVY